MSLNIAAISGRLTKDPELKKSKSGLSVCSFTVAVDRNVKKDQNGQNAADFINCIAWRQSADFLCQYGHKGSKVTLNGRIQTDNYTAQDGTRRFITQIVADHLELDKQQQKEEPAQSEPAYIPDPMPEENEDPYETSLHISSDDLPF